MPKFTVDLTDAEVKAMEIVVPDVAEWITNAAKGKANKCVERAIIEHDLSNTRPEKLTTEQKEQIILAATVPKRKERDATEIAQQVESLRLGDK